MIIQVEGLLNSRLLTLLFTDPADPLPLVPSHFFVGGLIVAPAKPSLADIPFNRVFNWQKMTQLVQNN